MTAVVRVLGPFTVRLDDGTWVARSGWRTSHAVNLVRILAVSLHQRRPAAELATMLWPEQDPEAARTALRGALSEARRTVGPDHVLRDGSDIVLQDVWTDEQAFRRDAAHAAACSASGRPRDALAATWRALEHWQGNFAPDEVAEWAAAERADLDRLRLELFLRGAEDAVCTRAWDTGRAMAEQALRQVPYSERAVRALLRAAGASGQVDVAVAAYTRLRRLLRDDLGVAPSSRTEQVYRDVLRDRSPARDVPFVGRRAALRSLRREVDAGLRRGTPTVVHLIGPAGVGKTRLLDHLAAASDVPIEITPGAAGCGPDRPDDGSAPAVAVLRDSTRERSGPWAAGMFASGRRVVLVASRQVADLELPPGTHRAVVPIGPMLLSEVKELAEVWLGGPITDLLLDHLATTSGRLPGALLDVLDAVSRSLRLRCRDGLLTLDAGMPPAPPWDRPLVHVPVEDLRLAELVDAVGGQGLRLDARAVDALGALGVAADVATVERLERCGVLLVRGDRVWLTDVARVELRRRVPESVRGPVSHATLAPVPEASDRRVHAGSVLDETDVLVLPDLARERVAARPSASRR